MIHFNIKILIKEFIKLIQFWQFNVLMLSFSVFFQCCLKVLTCKNSLSSPLPEIEITTLLVCSNHRALNSELLQRTVTLYIVSNILIQAVLTLSSSGFKLKLQEIIPDFIRPN